MDNEFKVTDESGIDTVTGGLDLSSQFQCPECRSTKIDYKPVKVTIGMYVLSCTCNNCGHTWTVRGTPADPDDDGRVI